MPVTVIPDSTMWEEAEKNVNTLLYMFFNGALSLGIVLLTLAILMIQQETGLKISLVLSSEGIIKRAFGFAEQDVIRNIISDLSVILENHNRIGDINNIDTTEGVVNAMYRSSTKPDKPIFL